MSTMSHLECSKCGQTYPADKVWNLCPKCQKPLLARYNLDSIKSKSIREQLPHRPPTLWRYSELLPVQSKQNQLTLGEGFTPLAQAQRLGREIHFTNLYIKDESLNPTTSFKARGLALAVSKALELGIKEVSIPSAGNAAGAMSAYAALAGMKAFVFMPRDVPEPFIAECQALGADVTLINGLITDCAKAAAEGIKKYSRFDLSTLKEPYRLEGKKTMGYEIAEQMGWKLPDVIIYPTGGGTGLVGMWKAFAEMEELGWISGKKPRMVSVQADGCAPIVRAFANKKDSALPWENARTIADGLRVPSAVGDFLILKAIYESNGTAVMVSDEEMMAGVYQLGRYQGIFACPEGGATLAAFHRLREAKWIKENETVVLFNTGSGHKYFQLMAKKQARLLLVIKKGQKLF